MELTLIKQGQKMSTIRKLSQVETGKLFLYLQSNKEELNEKRLSFIQIAEKAGNELGFPCAADTISRLSREIGITGRKKNNGKSSSKILALELLRLINILNTAGDTPYRIPVNQQLVKIAGITTS